MTTDLQNVNSSNGCLLDGHELLIPLSLRLAERNESSVIGIGVGQGSVEHSHAESQPVQLIKTQVL